MNGTWIDPARYDDRDLAKTIGHLNGFFNQASTADGRGLLEVAPPEAVRKLVVDALSGLEQPTSGSFEELCVRLTTCATLPNWRTTSDQVLARSLLVLTEYTANRRVGRNKTQTGKIAGLHVSKGGVPKKPISTAHIGFGGLDGDTQNARQHHGRPWQALCIWSVETIDRLRAEGHPISLGAAGENITLAGIDFTEATCGAQLICGDMIAEFTLTALPCAKNQRWFLGGQFNRMHHAVEPGVSRVYAAVVRPGTVTVGDEITLELR
jgi:MOSC domain-containing protein YiiM